MRTAFSGFKNLKSLETRFASHEVSAEASTELQKEFKDHLLKAKPNGGKTKSSRYSKLSKIAKGPKGKAQPKAMAKGRKGVGQDSKVGARLASFRTMVS